MLSPPNGQCVQQVQGNKGRSTSGEVGGIVLLARYHTQRKVRGSFKANKLHLGPRTRPIQIKDSEMASHAVIVSDL